jgi:dihydroxyacetone kinase-like protein
MTRSRRLPARPGKKNMVATTGKARSLGERSLGHPDRGAITISLILKAMNEFVAKA